MNFPFRRLLSFPELTFPKIANFEKLRLNSLHPELSRLCEVVSSLKLQPEQVESVMLKFRHAPELAGSVKDASSLIKAIHDLPNDHFINLSKADYIKGLGLE